jgi:glucose-1-phosphate thymidylyltransferase
VAAIALILGDNIFFERTLEKRQGLRGSCPEEVAFRMGFINRDDLVRLGRELEKSDYGRYLLAISDERLP